MSQNSIVLPTTGTVSGLAMTQDTNQALDTLRTNFSGASAPTSSEAYQTWYDTTNNTLYMLSGDATTWIPLFSFNQSSYTASPIVGLSISAPQGRLTLTSSIPVLATDVTSSAVVYYTPYQGNLCPIYNGTSFVETSFSNSTLTLSSGVHTSSNLFDVFCFLSSTAFVLGTGTAWATVSSRASSAVISQSSGLWVNTNTITLYNGSSNYSVSSKYATYLGTIYTTGTAVTAVQFKPAAAAGGSNNVIGIFNAYNRIRQAALERDSTGSWNYSSNVWQAADASNSNRISWVDGLQQIPVLARFENEVAVSSGNSFRIGVNLNSSSATPNVFGQDTFATALGGNQRVMMNSKESFYPNLGFNYMQAMENAVSNTASVMQIDIGTYTLILETEY